MKHGDGKKNEINRRKNNISVLLRSLAKVLQTQTFFFLSLHYFHDKHFASEHNASRGKANVL